MNTSAVHRSSALGSCRACFALFPRNAKARASPDEGMCEPHSFSCFGKTMYARACPGQRATMPTTRFLQRCIISHFMDALSARESEVSVQKKGKVQGYYYAATENFSLARNLKTRAQKLGLARNPSASLSTCLNISRQ